MSGFSCPHQANDECVKLKKPCDPGDKGCVLYGKFVFSNPYSPSNEALKRKEKRKDAKTKDSD